MCHITKVDARCFTGSIKKHGKSASLHSKNVLQNYNHYNISMKLNVGKCCAPLEKGGVYIKPLGLSLRIYKT